jgi:hypothetical protein
MEDWRKRIAVLLLQAIGVFLLCLQTLPFALALVKFVEGWMAAAILGSGMASVQTSQNVKGDQSPPAAAPNPLPPSVWLFRLATGMLVGMVVLGGAPVLISYFNGIRSFHAFAILGLAGIGLLIVSYRNSTFSIAIGLMTFINGFEVLLSIIEPSVMLSGLLAAVILSTAFLSAYLLTLEGGQSKP